MSASPFPLPMAFVAWETRPTGKWADGSIGGLIAFCKEHGFRTVALQIGEVTRQQVKWCQDGGLFVVLWNVVGANLPGVLDELQPDGVMPQIEGDGQYDGAIAGLTAIKARTLPKAIVTTYGGLVVLFPAGHAQAGQVDTAATAARWRKLEALGAKGAYVECYAADDPIHADLDRMLAQGTVYGIPATELWPVCGVYRSELPSAYKGLSKLGRDFAVYLAETMSDLQWQSWGALPPVPPPTPTPAAKLAYWQVRAGASLLFEVRAKTWPDGSTGLGKALAWEENHLDVIRSAKGVELVHVLK